jgi:hypothetical protein
MLGTGHSRSPSFHTTGINEWLHFVLVDMPYISKHLGDTEFSACFFQAPERPYSVVLAAPGSPPSSASTRIPTCAHNTRVQRSCPFQQPRLLWASKRTCWFRIRVRDEAAMSSPTSRFRCAQDQRTLRISRSLARSVVSLLAEALRWVVAHQ